MTDRPVSSSDILLAVLPQLDRAELLLKQLRTSGRKEEAALRVALFGVDRLRQVLDSVVRQIDDDDLAEQIAVYELIADQCAQITGHDVRSVYPALLRLFGEEDPVITANLEEPVPAVVTALRAAVVRVTATYSGQGNRGRDQRGERVVEIFFGAGPAGVRSRRVVEELPWEKLPEQVRERILGHGEPNVVFVLYPGAK
ncbi:hypothetical protein [Frankia sp. QA3]|uniref:hypothetical protein n=1 Tax=Frankia sp. QA3 TaxID=710111 RepID=UPI000269B665|nr:hypothetical protein [Frankia sp. QA3]EIV90796.1 hypothetical protein FraQA3DRAFT_0199 [Frankia sp. QA3]